MKGSLQKRRMPAWSIRHCGLKLEMVNEFLNGQNQRLVYIFFSLRTWPILRPLLENLLNLAFKANSALHIFKF